MSSGERPIGAAKGKQSDTEALCQPPPPPDRPPRMWCPCAGAHAAWLCPAGSPPFSPPDSRSPSPKGSPWFKGSSPPKAQRGSRGSRGSFGSPYLPYAPPASPPPVPKLNLTKQELMYSLRSELALHQYDPQAKTALHCPPKPREFRIQDDARIFEVPCPVHCPSPREV